MLDSEGLSRRCEVEHIEYDGLGTAILTSVNSVHNLDKRLSLVEGPLGAVLTDNGQFALFDDAIVHHSVVVPACFLSDGKDHAADRQFRASDRKIGQLCSVPTTGCASKFGGLNCVLHRFIANIIIVISAQKAGEETFSSCLRRPYKGAHAAED